MGPTEALVVFVCAWWMVFFMTLPWGVRGQWESEEGPIEGTEPGAPVRPGLGKKAMVATGGAAVVLVIVWTILTFELIKVEFEPFEFEQNQEQADQP